MKVVRWGDSLAIRIPPEVAEILDLKEGDDIIFNRSASGKVTIDLKLTGDQILERMRTLRRPLVTDFKFDRDEANER